MIDVIVVIFSVVRGVKRGAILRNEGCETQGHSP